MPAYSETDLIRARRPLADPLERGEAFCTLGHLEAEQRESATTDRAEVIREITANIAAFDGGGAAPAPVAAPVPAAALPTPTAASTAQPGPTSPNLLVDSMRARQPAAAGDQQPGGIDVLAASRERMLAGIASSRASMERVLRRQGLVAVDRRPTMTRAASASLDQELRQAGLLPQIGG